MSSPTWTAPLASAHARLPYNGFQLSTVDLDSFSPQCRTLACTGLISQTMTSDSVPLLLATTDVRSPKAKEILNNPRVQVLWWFSDTSEQFRMTGTATIVASPNYPNYQAYQAKLTSLPQWLDYEAKREEIFKAMPTYMSSYARPPWGTPLRSVVPSTEWPTVVDPTENSSEEEKRLYQQALGNYALIVIQISAVDYRTPNARVISRTTAEGHWEEEEVVMP